VCLFAQHAIKQHSSLTAQAIFALDAERRWALTGTPVQNALSDIYSLIRCEGTFEKTVHTHYRIDSFQFTSDLLAVLFPTLVMIPRGEDGLSDWSVYETENEFVSKISPPGPVL
jgi:hypothetical protein